MSALTLINGSIRKLPILLRILVIGAVSTALTYVMVGVLTGILGFVYTLVTNYTLWCVIPTAILIGVCTGKGGKNGGGLQRSASGIVAVLGAFVVLWAISGIMKAAIGFVGMRVPIFVVSMAVTSIAVHYGDIVRLANSGKEKGEPEPERDLA